jgi:hypothetical protein
MRAQNKVIKLAKLHNLTVLEEAGIKDGYPHYKATISGLKTLDGETIRLSNSAYDRKTAYKGLYSSLKGFLQSNKVVYSPNLTTINTGPK